MHQVGCNRYAMTTSKMIGWIDDRGRPLINLQSPNGTSVSALVDTGFNGEILVEGQNYDRLVDADFPCHLTTLFRRVEAVGAAPYARLGLARVQWHDDERIVNLQVVLNPEHAFHRGDPIVTVGTRFLIDSRLTIDFPEQFVTVEKV